MLHSVILDMGNVLLRYAPEHFLDRLGICNPQDRALLLGEIFHSPLWPKLDSGELTEAGLEEHARRHLPQRLHSAAHSLIFAWDKPLEPVAGMDAFLSDCKEAGLRLYLLSNASLRQPEYWPRVPGSQLFDGVVVSAFCGLVKPGEEIYRHTLEKFHLKPEECLFADDTEANVRAAEALGIHGFLFTGDVTALRRRAEALGAPLGKGDLP